VDNKYQFYSLWFDHCCFELFDIAGKTQYIYIIGKNIFHLHSLPKQTSKVYQRLAFIPIAEHENKGSG
jgi:hypothetical protein